MKKIIQVPLLVSLVLTSVLPFAQQHETIVELPSGNITKKEFTKEQILDLEKRSDDFSGLPKVELVNAEYPDGKLSATEKWPEGSWGRGYHTWPGVKIYPKNSYGHYFACRPMIRDVAGFIRGHLYLYLNDKALATSERLIKAGMDFLLEEQIKKGKNKGAYIWYLKRADQEDLTMDSPVNGVQPYETAHALVAMSEFYRAGIDYRREEILAAIQLSTANLLKIKWAKDPSVGNSNMKSLGAWSLAASYHVTKDEATYDQIVEIGEILIAAQNIDSTLQNGLWLTGGREMIEGREIYHDTKIFYHVMNIRGLLETFLITPDSESDFKWKLADGIKRGINHIILTRIDMNNRKNHKARYGFQSTNGERLPDWFVDEIVELEALVKLAYYSKNSTFFTESEHQSIVNLVGQISNGLNSENVWHINSIGHFMAYMGALEKNTAVFPE